MFKHLSSRVLNVLNLYTAIHNKVGVLPKEEYRERWHRYHDELWKLTGDDAFDVREALLHIINQDVVK